MDFHHIPVSSVVILLFLIIMLIVIVIVASSGGDGDGEVGEAPGTKWGSQLLPWHSPQERLP